MRAYQGWACTVLKTANCVKTQIAICPRRGTNTLREKRFAVGLFRQSMGNGPVQPTFNSLDKGMILKGNGGSLLNMAIGKMSARSMNKNFYMLEMTINSDELAFSYLEVT